MTHTKHVHLLLASVLLASVAFAQTRDSQPEDSASAEAAISAARNQYTPTAAASADATDGNTLAQFHRRSPGPPFPTRQGYPRASYRTPWMDHGSPDHIVVGAAIGFGIGAAIGAHNSAHSGAPIGGAIVVGGALFGFLGGCVGEAVATFPGLHYSSARRRRDYRPSWPEDDEESSLNSHSKAIEGHPAASANLASPNESAGVEAMAAPPPG
jgi:phage tail tape-measure protein